MARLDFYVGERIFLIVRLTAEQLLIGRDPDCDIQLPDERVSRIHAVITADADGHVLHDRSWNGTLLNFRKLEDPTRLRGGDRILIEDYVVTYQPDEAPPEDLPFRETMLDD